MDKDDFIAWLLIAGFVRGNANQLGGQLYYHLDLFPYNQMDPDSTMYMYVYDDEVAIKVRDHEVMYHTFDGCRQHVIKLLLERENPNENQSR